MRVDNGWCEGRRTYVYWQHEDDDGWALTFEGVQQSWKGGGRGNQGMMCIGDIEYTRPQPCFDAIDDSYDDHVWAGRWQDSMCVCCGCVWDGWRWMSGWDEGIRTYATRRQSAMMRRWSRQWQRAVTVMIRFRKQWWWGCCCGIF